MQDFRRDGGIDAHTAEGDAPRPGSVVDVSIVPDIASNATKPVVLNPICVRSARTGAARREACRRGARVTGKWDRIRQAETAEVRLDQISTAGSSASARLTARFGAPTAHAARDCRCQGSSRARSWPQHPRESGECRIIRAETDRLVLDREKIIARVKQLKGSASERIRGRAGRSSKVEQTLELFHDRRARKIPFLDKSAEAREIRAD